MLRRLTADQFLDLVAYADLEPVPDTKGLHEAAERMLDRRFALLAGVIAGSAGARTPSGELYTGLTYLRALHPEPDTASPARTGAPQSVARMEMLLRSWTDGANVMRKERGL